MDDDNVDSVHELKSFETEETITTNSEGRVQALFYPGVGSDSSSRIGSQVIAHSYQLRAEIGTRFADEENPPGSVMLGQAFRLLMVWDYKPNGATANVADILHNPKTTSLIELENSDRFEVLSDKVFAFGPARVDAADRSTYIVFPQYHVHKEYRRIGHKSTYSSTAAAQSSVVAGALLILVISGNDTPTVADNYKGTRINLTCRVRYSDA